MVFLCFPVVNNHNLQPHDTPYFRPIRIDDFVIDPFTREIRSKGKILKLTRIELRLLWILASDPAFVFNRNELLRRVWGEGVFVEPRTVDAHIARLRRLLKNEKDFFPSIETVWGMGYCLKKPKRQPEGQ